MATKSIHIKKSTKGSFTKMAKKAGKSVQQEATSVLNNRNATAAAKKKAQFAKNAAKWNHPGRSAAAAKAVKKGAATVRSNVR